MVAEHRREKEFSSGAKKKKKKEVDFHCEGCGRRITGRRTLTNPSTEALEIHHDPPIVAGGGKQSEMRALCGPRRCHELADRLAIQDGVSFGKVEQTLGEHPFAPYAQHLEKGRYRRAEGRVLRRLRRGSDKLIV